MTQPSTPETETMKRGPGRPKKSSNEAGDQANALDADAPEGIRMRTVYFVHTCQGDRLDPWVSNWDWATVLPTSHACGSCDWIVLSEGTIIAKKDGRRIHVPWSGCKNAIELSDPLTDDELKRAAL